METAWEQYQVKRRQAAHYYSPTYTILGHCCPIPSSLEHTEKHDHTQEMKRYKWLAGWFTKNLNG
jgi:hypothetical protein